MKIGFSKNNSFFWVFTDGVWKAQRALQSETRRQRKRQWICGARQEWDITQSNSNSCNYEFFFSYIHSQANHRARCEHKDLWKLPSVCMEIFSHPLSVLSHLLQISQQSHQWLPGMDMGQEVSWWTWKIHFLPDIAWLLPVHCPRVIMSSPLNRSRWCANKCTCWLLN